MEKRKTVGVLVGGITDDYTRLLCEGLKNAAEACNVKLVVFPGKFLDRDYSGYSDIMYEYQYETIFSYAKKDTLDGLIVAADCIGCLTTKSRREEFVHQYDGIPCVLVSSQIDGYVSVNYDNNRGICEAIDYLVNVLHYTKIGMVGGPSENTDSMERRATFESALWKHGIAPQEKRYVEGNLSGTAKKAYAKLLDDNPDLEAVFCVNDETAAGLYEELKARKIMPGRDISVFGYDDTEWCSQIFPTLSSVKADVSVLGKEALGLLCRMMKGEPVESVVLPTKLVLRDSFAVPKEKDVEQKEDLLEQYLNMNHRLDEQREKQNRMNFQMKNIIMKILCFEKGNDQSFGEIMGTMDWMDIHNAVLYSFETPMIHLLREPFHVPEELYLKAKLCADEVENVPALEQKISAGDMFRMETFTFPERNMMVALPLYANEMLYGILLCDLTSAVLEHGEFLGNIVSAAVKMINLLKTNETILKQLEESLLLLQENNLELDSLTKKDPLTGEDFSFRQSRCLRRQRRGSCRSWYSM